MSLFTNQTGETYFQHYTAIDATRAMHNVPRFGHTNDFSVLFSGDKVQVKDYATGLLFPGIFILCWFAVWLLILLCMKWSKKMISGKAMVMSEPVYKKQQTCNKVRAVRATFIISAVLVILFTALLVSLGLKNLENAINTMSQSNQEVYDIVTQFQGIATSLESIGLNANTTRDELVATLTNFCPNNPAVSQLANFQEDAKQAASLLTQLGDFITNQVNAAQVGLAQAAKSSEDIQEALDSIDLNSWQTIVVSILYTLIPTLMVVGVIMAWLDVSSKTYKCLLSWLVLPLFIILIIVAVLVSALAITISISNSDFCSGGTEESPDVTVEDIVSEQKNLDPESILSKAIFFYVSQCTTTNPWAFIETYQTQIVGANATVAEVQNQLNTITIAQLSALCQQDYSSFASLLDSFQSTLQILASSVVQGLILLACRRIVPIYTNTVYDTACMYSIRGCTWTWTSYLIVAFFGMVMVTLRSAWQDVEYLNDPDRRDATLDDYAGASVDDVYKDDESSKPSWNRYESPAPREEYGQNDSHANNSEPDDVVYYDEPQVVRTHDPNDAPRYYSADGSSMYKPDVY